MSGLRMDGYGSLSRLVRADKRSTAGEALQHNLNARLWFAGQTTTLAIGHAPHNPVFVRARLRVDRAGDPAEGARPAGHLVTMPSE